MDAVKLEYTWDRWEADPLIRSKKYFPTICDALKYCDDHLQHHKDWRIYRNGTVVETMMQRLLRKPRKFDVVFYHRFACETQTFMVMAKDKVDAERLFWIAHSREQFKDCIEMIYAALDYHYVTEEELLKNG
ncbi:hypothetical protein D3C71_881590 [compost metagenome]